MSAIDLCGVRLALVGPQAPPAGGMARNRDQLIRSLTDEGVLVWPVSVNAPYRPAWAARLRGVRALVRLVPYVARLWRVCGVVEVMHVMANSGWSWHLFAAPAVWVARLRGVPVVVSFHGGLAEGFLTRQHALVRPTLRRAHLMVPSGFLQSVFGRFGFEATVVPNRVDVAAFAPGPARPAGAHVVVTRNLEPVYDIATALRAFARLRAARPDARLTIAGTGPQAQALQALRDELGLKEAVTFCGRLQTHDIAALYAQADVALNPSLADNLPNSLLEALAAGVPVVSTRVGGVPWLVEHEVSALLVTPGCPDQMAAALQRMIESPNLRARLVAAGREIALQYRWDAVRPRLLQVYAKAMQAEIK